MAAGQSGATLGDAVLPGAFVTCSYTGVLGTSIAGTPDSLPVDWDLTAGTLAVPIVACPTISSSGSIPPWVQAHGRDGKDATCGKGWSPSWQKWVEDVTGGWVCTRNIASLG